MPAITERPALAPFDATAPSAPLSLRLRIFLLIALLLGLAVGAAVLVSVNSGSRIAEAAIQRSLEANAALQSEFAEHQLEEVQLKIQLLAADAAFVSYVADAQGDALGLGEGVATNAGSIQDLLQERQADVGFDLGIVLSGSGDVLANTEQVEALQQNLADDPFVDSAIRSLEPLSGYWRMQDRLYEAAIWPLDQANDLVGFLIIAKRVDEKLASRVGRVSQADIAYLLPVGSRIAIVGSSLTAASLQSLRSAVDEGIGGIPAAVREALPLSRIELQLDGSQWIGRLLPLDVDAGGELGAALQLSSVDQSAAGYRSILNSVVLAGLLSLVVALPLSLLLTRTSLRPLATMAQAAKAAAAGDYQTRIAIGGGDELAQLSQAFDSLLSDLRGERDIESYVTHLSRLLPDPGEESLAGPLPQSIAPQRGRYTLLAFEKRGLARELQAMNAETAWQQLATISDPLFDISAQHGGEAVLSSGSRWGFAFSGDDALEQALQCLTALWQQAPDGNAALAEGDLLVGSLEAGDRQFAAALGLICQQTDLLLADSVPGQALLPRPLGDALKQRFGDDSIEVARGHSSGKAFYATNATRLLNALPALKTATITDQGPDNATVITPASGATRVGGNISGGGDLRPGTRFGGRYQILSVLGTGGMGVVYKARDLELDDVVALKMLKPAALVDQEHLERLKSEIRLARRITHANVLRTFDFGEHKGLPYISMEYVRGMTLRYLIKQTGRVPYTAALRIARQLCAGLQAAHEVGVLHRDIKPENLILEASGNAKLMDFGIARPIRRSAPGQTEPGMFVGTPNYSAPEQLAGKEVDHRADIYACGVLMCEMFSGHLPYEGDTTIDLYMAQMQGSPTHPSEYWPDIPSQLEALILRCIAVEIGARFPDVTALAAELNRLRA